MAQNNLRVIVVGGGAAGISAASTARTVNPEASVILFTEYEDVAYSPCGIPFVHGREKPDIPGSDLEGLHYVKNMRQAMELDKMLDQIKKVGVVAATPLGIEMTG